MPFIPKTVDVSVLETDHTTLLTRLSAARAGYLDNINKDFTGVISITNEQTVYPITGDGVGFTLGNGSFSAYTEVVPVNTITNAFLIVGYTILPIGIGGVNAREGVVQFAIGTGGSEVPKNAFGVFSSDGNPHKNGFYGLEKPLKVAANTRVAVRGIAEGASVEVEVRVHYIELPLTE